MSELNRVLAAIALKGNMAIELERFIELFDGLTVEQQGQAIAAGWVIQIDLARRGFSIVVSEESERTSHAVTAGGRQK